MAVIELVQLVTLLGFGFILGLKHALDADHIVAVSTVVSQTKSLKKSSLFGAIWGVGHTTTLLLAGLVILTLRLTIPNELALSFEFLIGIVLVILGIDVLRKTIKERKKPYDYNHEKIVVEHLRSHKGLPFHSHAHKSFFIGMLHGLAGSAALMLLVLSTVKSLVQGLLYILVFGFGSILGMLVVSTIIGIPFVLTAKFDKIHNNIKLLAGTISIILGIILMYEIGYISGMI